jgi:tetratricopeptide (TPR) repeat protein
VTRARLHYAVGRLRADAGDLEGAESHIRTAVTLAPSFVEAVLELGTVLGRQRRYLEGLEQLERVLESDPDNTLALFQQANTEAALRRFEAATETLGRLLAVAPSHAPARLLLANARLGVGDTAAAEAALAEVIALDAAANEKAAAHDQLARILERRGDLPGAAEHCRASLELLPSPATRLRLAGVLAYGGQYDQALPLYREVVEAEPGNERARVGQVGALILARRLDEAAVALDQGLQSLPESLLLRHLMARLLAASPEPALRDGPRALELAQAVLGEAPSSVHAETLAMALAACGRFEKAAEVQQRVIAEAQRSGARDLLSRLRRHLELYRAGTACCADSGVAILLP